MKQNSFGENETFRIAGSPASVAYEPIITQEFSNVNKSLDINIYQLYNGRILDYINSRNGGSLSARWKQNMVTNADKPESVLGADPLYRRIQNTLRGRIRQGDWLPGQALPSRRVLCSEFGTTQVTLDKAMEGLIREGLVRASRGSGTFVTAAPARALRIGVVIKRGDVDETLGEHWDENFYFGPLFRGIRDGVAGKPVEIIYSHIQRGDYEGFYRETALDGMILILPALEDVPLLHTLTAAGVVYVAAGFSTDDPADAPLPCVDTNNRQGASDAMNHLLSLGHRRIAIINLATSHANHHDRLEGYFDALAASGVAVVPGDLVLHPTYTMDRFDAHIEAWLTRVKVSPGLPTAIFACDYIMALATLRVLRRHGLRVPEDVSLVAFDDPLSAAHLTPPLTTVRQPVHRLGLLAAQRLLEVLQARPNSDLAVAGKQILPNELIVRESTCPPQQVLEAQRLDSPDQ
jgi:GntR family transcriptional regulator of arabinose operon